MPTFEADTGQMSQIAARLSGVVKALNSEAHGGLDASALGHPEAVSGLTHFLSNWSHGRSEIASGVSTAQQCLSGAAHVYGAVEGAVVSAAESVAGALGL